MWETIQNDLFLALCFGVPPLLLVGIVVNVVRQMRQGRGQLAPLARARGWVDTTTSKHRFRFEGSIDGTTFAFEAPRVRGRHGHRSTGSYVRIRRESGPGLFVVQHAIPEAILSVVGSLGAALLQVIGRDEMSEAMSRLERLDAPGFDDYVAYATPDAHRDAPHTAALGKILADLDARAARGVVLYAWNDELVLLNREPALETAELVDVAVRCHRELDRQRAEDASLR